MPIARVVLGPYSNRVLNVVKAKYDLGDKSGALNKFIELYGANELDPEVDDAYVRKILAVEKKHFDKHGYKSMSASGMKKLFGK